MSSNKIWNVLHMFQDELQSVWNALHSQNTCQARHSSTNTSTCRFMCIWILLCDRLYHIIFENTTIAITYPVDNKFIIHNFEVG